MWRADSSVPNDGRTVPNVLFLRWQDSAIETGARQPQAGILTTTRADGTPVGRTLIIKDIVDGGYDFSTHQTSRKGIELAANPRASFVFFWRESGRQARITGAVRPLGYDESRADWEERPSYTGEPNPDWQVYRHHPRRQHGPSSTGRPADPLPLGARLDG